MSYGWWWAASSGQTGLRDAEYTAGLEGRMSIPLGLFEAEIALGAGPLASIVTMQNTGVERSSILDTAALVGLRLEPILRLNMEWRTEGGRRLRWGLGTALSVDAPSWCVLPFKYSQAVITRALKVRVFLCSETL